MLKHRGISRSSAILGSDSPQSNNRKDNSFWVTPFIPREKSNVKHAIAGYLKQLLGMTSIFVFSFVMKYCIPQIMISFFSEFLHF